MLKTLTLKLTFGLLASALFVSSVNGQAAPISVAGDYAGTLAKMHIHQDSGGKLTATLNSVDEGDNGLLCDHFVRAGTKFSFSVPTLDGAYEGETNAMRAYRPQCVSNSTANGAPPPGRRAAPAKRGSRPRPV